MVQYGYLIFLLKDPLAEQGRHSFYDEHVLQKFVKSNIERRRILMGIPLEGVIFTGATLEKNSSEVVR